MSVYMSIIEYFDNLITAVKPKADGYSPLLKWS